MTTPVVVSSTIYLVTTGGRYELQGVQASFGVNGVNVCIATLAVGRKEGSPSPVFIGFERGAEATVFVENAQIVSEDPAFLNLTAPNYRLFTGVVDDFGPSDVQYGRFAIQVRLFGCVARLASGTLSSSKIVPKSFRDTNVAWQYATGSADPLQFDPAKASVDLWDAMSDIFIQIATDTSPPSDSVTATIIAMFGANVNLGVAETLADVQGALVWNNNTLPYAPGIIYNMNQLMTREWFYESFLNRILGFGEMLRFALIENGSGMRIVPHTPFFRRTSAYVLTAATYSSLRWQFREFSSYCGALLVDGTGHDAVQKGGTGLVVGRYRFDGDPLGQVHVGPIPPFLTQASEDMFTGGGGSRSLFPATEDGGNTITGDRLAKLMAWELNFRGRILQVTCPCLRTDIGPLEAIRVDFPLIEELQAGLDTPAVYGSVQRVTIAIDATSQVASTTYDIDYVRSFTQQKFQIDPALNSAEEHPFFNRLYVGGRLDTNQPRGNTVI